MTDDICADWLTKGIEEGTCLITTPGHKTTWNHIASAQLYLSNHANAHTNRMSRQHAPSEFLGDGLGLSNSVAHPGKPEFMRTFLVSYKPHLSLLLRVLLLRLAPPTPQCSRHGVASHPSTNSQLSIGITLSLRQIHSGRTATTWHI